MYLMSLSTLFLMTIFHHYHVDAHDFDDGFDDPNVPYSISLPEHHLIIEDEIKTIEKRDFFINDDRMNSRSNFNQFVENDYRHGGGGGGGGNKFSGGKNNRNGNNNNKNNNNRNNDDRNVFDSDERNNRNNNRGKFYLFEKFLKKKIIPHKQNTDIVEYVMEFLVFVGHVDYVIINMVMFVIHQKNLVKHL